MTNADVERLGFPPYRIRQVIDEIINKEMEPMDDARLLAEREAVVQEMKGSLWGSSVGTADPRTNEFVRKRIFALADASRPPASLVLSHLKRRMEERMASAPPRAAVRPTTRTSVLGLYGDEWGEVPPTRRE